MTQANAKYLQQLTPGGHLLTGEEVAVVIWIVCVVVGLGVAAWKAYEFTDYR